MKSVMITLCLFLIILSFPLGAQTTPAPAVNPPLPGQVFGALAFYNNGKANGSVFAAVPFPGAASGTYLYNSVDLYSHGKGQIMTVPTTGLAQHVAWMTPKLELFGLLAAGIALAPSTPAPGTTVTAAFGGGAGLNVQVKPNFYVPILFKVVQAGGINTLAFGAGIAWGK